MSSPPALSSVGGSAYDGLAFLWPLELCCRDTSDVPRRATAYAISLAADILRTSVVTGSYGLIVPLP